ncbi:hypothetical protein TCCBUS3UF1_10310 [Thermus sp. CCB_US3_UF1]|nr:hypothetical protein TCCBUS3UF1_10310 [Thermus sp. CCB_US3_UF1]
MLLRLSLPIPLTMAQAKMEGDAAGSETPYRPSSRAAPKRKPV